MNNLKTNQKPKHTSTIRVGATTSAVAPQRLRQPSVSSDVGSSIASGSSDASRKRSRVEYDEAEGQYVEFCLDVKESVKQFNHARYMAWDRIADVRAKCGDDVDVNDELLTIEQQINEMVKVLGDFEDELVSLRSRYDEADFIHKALREQRKILSGSKERRPVVQQNVASFPPISNRKGKKSKQPTRSYSLVVKSAKSDEKSPQVEAKLKSVVNPREDGIRIKKIRNAKKNTALVVQTHDKGDFLKLKNKLEKGTDLEVSEPKSKQPRLIFYDVPAELEGSDIIECIRTQNLLRLVDYGITDEMIKNELKFGFKIGKRREGVTNWVAEASPKLRNALRSLKNCYIGWGCCSVKDFLSISRCYKCQGLYHIAKTCKMEKDTCGHCASEGHSFNDCPSKKDKRKCALCKRAGKPCEHKPADCPIYDQAIESLKSRTDYIGESREFKIPDVPTIAVNAEPEKVEQKEKRTKVESSKLSGSVSDSALNKIGAKSVKKGRRR